MSVGEEAELVEGEGEGEPIDPRMAAVLEAAESGDLETLCSLFDQVEVSRCTLSSRSTVITPCFTPNATLRKVQARDSPCVTR